MARVRTSCTAGSEAALNHLTLTVLCGRSCLVARFAGFARLSPKGVGGGIHSCGGILILDSHTTCIPTI